MLAAAGHTALDCTLSGTGAQAVNRDLVVYASGDAAVIAAQMPLFGDFARAAHDIGAFGNGSRMKFVANLLVAIHNVAAAEAMVLANAAGLDPDLVVQLAGAGAGASRMFDMRAPMMAARCYTPATMRVSTWQKDMDIIGIVCPRPGCDAAAVRGQCADLHGGDGKRDWASRTPPRCSRCWTRRIRKPDAIKQESSFPARSHAHLG